MRRAIAVHCPGSWPAEAATATVTLAHDQRHRRRIALRDDRGEPFLLDLPRATALADGDGLELAGGGWILTRAAAEKVLEIQGRSAQHLVRLAWHLGNRHVPVQALSGGLRLAADPVLAEMLRGLGAEVSLVEAPFSPEPGAYDAAGCHPDQSWAAQPWSQDGLVVRKAAS